MTIEQIVSELIRQKITLGELNKALLRRALYHYGSMRKVSKVHGYSRMTIHKRMRELGLTIEDLKAFKDRQGRLL
jgi:transcriptional regulator of acetoin/glycerol metabolism